MIKQKKNKIKKDIQYLVYPASLFLASVRNYLIFSSKYFDLFVVKDRSLTETSDTHGSLEPHFGERTRKLTPEPRAHTDSFD